MINALEADLHKASITQRVQLAEGWLHAKHRLLAKHDASGQVDRQSDAEMEGGRRQ